MARPKASSITTKWKALLRGARWSIPNWSCKLSSLSGRPIFPGIGVVLVLAVVGAPAL